MDDDCGDSSTIGEETYCEFIEGSDKRSAVSIYNFLKKTAFLNLMIEFRNFFSCNARDHSYRKIFGRCSEV